MEEIKIILNENIKFIIIVGVAYASDFISGFSKAVLLKDVQSSKLKKSVVKGIGYFLFIIIGCCLEILFPVSDKTPMWKLQLICIGISLTDFYSVYENMKEYSDIPIVAKIINYFKKDVEEKSNSYIPDLDEIDYINEKSDGDDNE